MSRSQNIYRGRIGGPGTLLPRSVEASLAWLLALSCLSVSGYHYLKNIVLQRLRWLLHKLLSIATNNKGTEASAEDVWLPMTTCTTNEVDRLTSSERLAQLMRLIQIRTKEATGKSIRDLGELNDVELVSVIRNDETCRRLATLALHPRSSSTRPRESKLQLPDKDIIGSLRRRLVRVWSRLMALPSLEDLESKPKPPYEISLILPCYRERPSDISKKLELAAMNCAFPNRVQVLVVDAGHCGELEPHIETTITEKNCCGPSCWGSVTVLNYTQGGGRGSCQNFGARFATGKILTFCHSDTRLPLDWDVTIRDAFFLVSPKSKKKGGRQQPRASSCAFQFGIDLSATGLNGGPYPPGIKAIEFTANLRTRMYSLPYGDQCLSIPRTIFRYIGGFPYQSLMEDYEIVDLLRRRSRLLIPGTTTAAASDGGLRLEQSEELVILPGKPALCSPRRWQQHGVLFVTSTNSKIVNLYESGMSADDCYESYYGRAPPTKQAGNGLSPWEVDLVNLGIA